jgi:hypothetical protein
VITYEITAEADSHLISAYEAFMRGRHIPELLATGCFVAASFSRSDPCRYRVRYEAANAAALDRYLEVHAAALRADMQTHFPSGIRVTRETWEVLESWLSPATDEPAE